MNRSRQSGSPLGSGGDLREHLGQLSARAVSTIESLDEDLLLGENRTVLVESIVSQHVPASLTLNWNELTREGPTETSIPFQDRWGRTGSARGVRLILRIPGSGALRLLTMRATSAYIGNPVQGMVEQSGVTLRLEGREITPEQVTSFVEQSRGNLDQMVAWINADLGTFRIDLTRAVEEAVNRRAEHILKMRALDAALAIPVTPTGTGVPVPARPRPLVLPTRAPSSPFAPEAILEEATYESIMDTVVHWARGAERTPATLRKLNEEEIRDTLLLLLNGMWEGRAGGEVFNGAGKTDILLRHDDRNVFIAEFKFLEGAPVSGSCPRPVAQLPGVAGLEGGIGHAHQADRRLGGNREAARGNRWALISAHSQAQH